jgi:hypothetical protein
MIWEQCTCLVEKRVRGTTYSTPDPLEPSVWAVRGFLGYAQFRPVRNCYFGLFFSMV